MVKALLGATALAARKMEFGLPLVVLGVSISCDKNGFECRPSWQKMAKCIAAIESALETGMLQAGAAAKLVGRLLWATQYLFHRIGRAMLRPLFDQKRSR